MSQTPAREATGSHLCLQWKKLGNRSPVIVSSERTGTVTLVGDRVFHARGGGHLYMLSLQDYTWTKLDNIFEGIHKGHAAQLAFDKLYYFGHGIDGVLEFDVVLESARLIKGETKLPGGNLWMSAVFAPWRKQIIAFGGYDRSYRRMNTTQAFNVESETWTLIEMRGTPPEPRTGHAAATYGTNMYVCGGYGVNGRALGDLWIGELRNSVAPIWSLVKINGNSLTKFQLPSLTYLSNCFVLSGGIRGPTENLHIYFLHENSWHDRYSSQLMMYNQQPPIDNDHLALTLTTGILYFTDYGIYLLSAEWNDLP